MAAVNITDGVTTPLRLLAIERALPATVELLAHRKVEAFNLGGGPCVGMKLANHETRRFGSHERTEGPAQGGPD